MELFILLVLPSIIIIGIMSHLVKLSLIQKLTIGSTLILFAHAILKVLIYISFSTKNINEIFSYPILYVKVLGINIIINIVLSIILYVIINTVSINLEKKGLDDQKSLKKNKDK